MTTTLKEQKEAARAVLKNKLGWPSATAAPFAASLSGELLQQLAAAENCDQARAALDAIADARAAAEQTKKKPVRKSAAGR